MYPDSTELDFICPEKPTYKALIEAFNGPFPEKYLNEIRFLSPEDAEETIKSWLREYNEW